MAGQTWMKGEYSYPAKLKELAKCNELVQDAIRWLADCDWGDVDEQDIAEMPPLIIVRAVQLHYHGGVGQFIEDTGQNYEE
jgi:hypothetical protein